MIQIAASILLVLQISELLLFLWKHLLYILMVEIKFASYQYMRNEMGIVFNLGLKRVCQETSECPERKKLVHVNSFCEQKLAFFLRQEALHFLMALFTS